ncbi:MAG TPA: hypothetical protein VIR31_00090 [Nitrososphaeraceae archaeon]
MTEYEKFVKQMDKLKATKPYMSEKDFNAFHGINTEEVIEPLQIRPKKDARQVNATMKNYNKIERVKKPKVEKQPRKKMSDEEKRKKKNEWRQSYLQSEKGRAKRREINARYAERNRSKLNADAVRRYHENKNG